MSLQSRHPLDRRPDIAVTRQHLNANRLTTVERPPKIQPPVVGPSLHHSRLKYPSRHLPRIRGLGLVQCTSLKEVVVPILDPRTQVRLMECQL